MANCHIVCLAAITVVLFARLCTSVEDVNWPLSESLVEFDDKFRLPPLHLPRTANVQAVADVIHQTLHPNEPPGKLRVEADVKNLDLHNWILPCNLLVDNQGRQLGRSIQSTNSTVTLSTVANVVRAAFFLKCVAISETLHLPADILKDYYKAVLEVGSSKGLTTVITKLLLLPFTFIISIRDLITKILAYVVTSVLPLFW